MTVNLHSDNAQWQNITKIETLGDGSMRVSFAGIPGRSYRVQSTDSLAPANIIETHNFNSLNLDIPDGDPSGLANVQNIVTNINLISDVDVSIHVVGTPDANPRLVPCRGHFTNRRWHPIGSARTIPIL